MILKFTIYNDIEEFKNNYHQCDKGMGVVYILECDNEIKIGKTINPLLRISNVYKTITQYGKQSVYRIAVSQAHHCSKESEDFLHNLYADYRIPKTELFHLKFEQCAYQYYEIQETYKQVQEKVPDDMQIKIMSFMRNELNLKVMDLLVFAIIHDASKYDAWYTRGNAHLEKFTGASNKTIIESIKRLCERGLVEKISETSSDGKVVRTLVKHRSLYKEMEKNK